MLMPLKSDLFQFLGRESPAEVKRLIGLSIFVGIVNTAIIGMINACAKMVTDGESIALEFFLFAFLLIFFLFLAKHANEVNIRSTQDLIYRFKIRILRDVFKSNLTRIDSIGRGYITEVMMRDTQMVSQSVSTLVTTFQAVATLFFLTLYLATVSITAFFIISVASVLIFVVGVREMFKVTTKLQEVAVMEAEVNSLYSDFLNGFKEIQINDARAWDMTHDMMKQSTIVNDQKSRHIIDITNFFNYMQVILYVVVGIIVFVVPVVSPTFSEYVTTSATTALFLAGCLAGLITSIPSLSQANVSAKALQDLAEKLEIKGPEEEIRRDEHFEEISSIELSNVSYRHSGTDPQKRVVLGPISYKFEAGHIYFIRGHNGSGKTTLIRILTGLYQPMHGEILVNGQLISVPASSDYRNIFSAVFSDFFLFKKLYGIQNPDPATIRELISTFRMEGKVDIVNGVFSDLNFSTGQRKRIALIVALLEQKQIMILDEWAADQDPEFRQEFYEHIIPRLRAMGKTVIAITHDDHYYNVADHVLYLTDGKLSK